MYRETLLGFRNVPATKKLPKDLDVDVLRCVGDTWDPMVCSYVFTLISGMCRALSEASFFDTGAVGVTGQPRPPLRSRLIHDEATSSSGNGTMHRVVTPMTDRWDAGKKSVQYGGGKGGVTSPSGSRSGGTSRWVKMEEEESWRKRSDDGDMPAPRYAWNDAHIMAQRAQHDDDEKTPEWATLNPNQKIQITADAIEAERQKMQATWRKEKKSDTSGEVEEILNDEIEMWKREQEEHDRTAAEATYHEHQVSTSASKGQPVNLAQLFGGRGVPPAGQEMNTSATQTGQYHTNTPSTSDQQAMLLAAQLRQARLNGEPPASSSSSSSSSQQQGKNLLAMLHQQQQQQQQPPQSQHAYLQQQAYQQRQQQAYQQQQQGRGMPMMMGMPPPPQSPGVAAGGMPMRPPMPQYSMPMPPPPGHPGMPPPHMMPPPPNMMMMRPPPPGFSPGMMPQQQQQQQQQQQAPVRPGQPVNIAALFGSSTGGAPQ